jgi:hypothetical protein
VRKVGSDDPIFLCDAVADLMHFCLGYAECRKS